MQKQSKKKNGSQLYIGVCCYGGVRPEFMASMIQLCRKNTGAQINLLQGESLVCRARNRIVKRFLETDCEGLLQIDTDISFDPESMLRMVESGLDVVGGMYALKTIRRQWCLNALLEKKFERGPEGLTPVSTIGTGMLYIKRVVFEKMIASGMVEEYPPDDTDQPGRYFDFFKAGVAFDVNHKRKRYMSEDWYFCQMARQAGFEVYADTRNVGVHFGNISYPMPEGAEELWKK